MSAAKEKNIATLEALRDLTKRVEKIKLKVRNQQEELTASCDKRLRKKQIREQETEAVEASSKRVK